MITVVLGNEGIRELQSYLMRQQITSTLKQKIAIKGKLERLLLHIVVIFWNTRMTKEGYGVAYVGKRCSLY